MSDERDAQSARHSSGGGDLPDWNPEDLENVDACPVCGSYKKVLTHDEVRDWTFKSAPGVWRYWQCAGCQSLYLNPRPTPASIGRAYAAYYTHEGPGSPTGIKSLKLRWKNERLSARFGRNIEPRLHLPSVIQPAVGRRGSRMALPFGWEELVDMKPGRLMDVGCGSGATLMLARQLGWDAQGIEMDSAAVASARNVGLEVEEGGYERLRDHTQAFDCIACSHVIEHVFDPVDMVRAIHAALKPGGRLLLATPNVKSDAHQYFGRFWRGLEAPRHLVMFSEATLIALLQQSGFIVESRSDGQLETARESARIARGGNRTNSQDRDVARQLVRSLKRTADGQDFIKLLACRA
jgi:2-polyprenyl-3-methyl-5-hydroxy-6-metoxy-1,4-benzoquinol methylase